MENTENMEAKFDYEIGEIVYCDLDYTYNPVENERFEVVGREREKVGEGEYADVYTLKRFLDEMLYEAWSIMISKVED